MQELAKDFKIYLEQLGYRKSSVQMLPACVNDFLKYHHIINPKKITGEQIESFYRHLLIRPHKRKEGGLSERYINHHIYALKLFFNWLENINRIILNPMSAMQFKKPVSKPREPLSSEEMTKLFRHCASAKETAILHLFYSCGLRKSEGEALNISDIHFKTNLLYIREGKNNKRRAIPITEKVSKDLESYLVHETNISGTKAFLLNKTGTRMKGESYNKILKEILKRSGIEKEISLHYLRHSIATHLLENGLPIERIRDFLGHKHLESTQVYAKVNLKRHGL